MIARLTRYYSPQATLGELEIEGERLCTLEPPWRDNEKNISCIPEGLYKVTRHVSHTKGDCFILNNVINRTSVLIHIGNEPHETQGCILVGESFSQSTFMIHKSAKAMTRLFAAAGKTFLLSIGQYQATFNQI